MKINYIKHNESNPEFIALAEKYSTQRNYNVIDFNRLEVTEAVKMLNSIGATITSATVDNISGTIFMGRWPYLQSEIRLTGVMPFEKEYKSKSGLIIMAQPEIEVTILKYGKPTNPNTPKRPKYYNIVNISAIGKKSNRAKTRKFRINHNYLAEKLEFSNDIIMGLKHFEH